MFSPSHSRLLLPLAMGITCISSFLLIPTEVPYAYKHVKVETANKQSKPQNITRKSFDNTGSKVVMIAKRYLGTPYQWGGGRPDGFDCSGFVQYVMHQAGISIPRITYEQYKFGYPVDRNHLQKGDLVFFQTDTSGASHVGIYVGDQTFIQADSSKGVKISSLEHPYWKHAYLGARRVILL
jgi:cell wall-associated NlpC family hydrolase